MVTGRIIGRDSDEDVVGTDSAWPVVRGAQLLTDNGSRPLVCKKGAMERVGGSPWWELCRTYAGLTGEIRFARV